MRVRNAFLGIILGISLGLFEATWATFLPQPFANLKPILPLVVFCVLLQRPAMAMIIGMSAGATIDLFTLQGASLAGLRYVIIALGIQFLAQTILTNQSLYAALALTLIARLFEWLWLWAAQLVAWLAHASLGLLPIWADAWRTCLADALILSFCFFVHTLVIKRFMRARFFRAHSRTI